MAQQTRRFMWSIPLALVLALVVGSRITNTASVNFANDVNAAIDPVSRTWPATVPITPCRAVATRQGSARWCCSKSA